jgi:HlyD family secretion protein
VSGRGASETLAPLLPVLNRRPALASLRAVQTKFLAALAALAVTSLSCKQKAGPPSVSGTIETDEVHVASRYGGRVEKILAWEGDVLTNGQVIAELDAAELRAQRDQAAALLGEWRAGPRAQEIDAARAEWEAVVAQLELANIEAKRAVELFAQKTISATERDQAVSRAAALEKSVAAARSRYELLLAGTRPERLAQAQARLAELDALLREMRVTAPTNGVLEVLSVKAGDVLAPNREVATLLLTGHTWVRVYVPQPWLGLIRLGQRVRVRVDSWPGKEFEGEVEQISRAAEFTPRNVQTPGERVKQVFGVKVRLADDALRAGMSADVLFPGVE